MEARLRKVLHMGFDLLGPREFLAISQAEI